MQQITKDEHKSGYSGCTQSMHLARGGSNLEPVEIQDQFSEFSDTNPGWQLKKNSVTVMDLLQRECLRSVFQLLLSGLHTRKRDPLVQRK